MKENQNKGPKGKRGAIGICPACGSCRISWDAGTDVSYCSCGWSNEESGDKQNKGDVGDRGLVGYCPVCGRSFQSISYDSKTDTCTYVCGWTNSIDSTKNTDSAKQIAEMAKTLGDTWIVDLEGNPHDLSEVLMRCDIENIAECLYNAGYRKQIEGEWTYSENKKTMKCTRCRLRMKTYDVRRYCPNCGAKMKGGASNG